MSFTLFAHFVLQPWTGSREQVSALMTGAVKKSKAKAIYDISWDFKIEQSEGLLPVANAVPIHRRDGASLLSGNGFVLNFQPYYLDYNVPYDEEFYAYDFSDAITQMFVYLTTASAGAALVKGLPSLLGVTWATTLKVFTDLRQGNFQAACASLSDVHGNLGKAHGGAVSSHKMGAV